MRHGCHLRVWPSGWLVALLIVLGGCARQKGNITLSWKWDEGERVSYSFERENQRVKSSDCERWLVMGDAVVNNVDGSGTADIAMHSSKIKWSLEHEGRLYKYDLETRETPVAPFDYLVRLFDDARGEYGLRVSKSGLITALRLPPKLLESL